MDFNGLNRCFVSLHVRQVCSFYTRRPVDSLTCRLPETYPWPWDLGRVPPWGAFTRKGRT